MKTAIIPPIRVEPELKKQLEDVLEPGETLSSFVLAAAVQAASVRKAEQAFVKRALASERRAETTGYAPGGVVFARLEGILATAKRKRVRRK